jgi:glutathione synthase/RimK-type ligase-like ATP-grasp enzyme
MKSIALVLYGDSNSTRNALVDDGFKLIADALMEVGFNVESVLYHPSDAKKIQTRLEQCSAVVSWVEPRDRVVRGEENLNYDEVLTNLSNKGVLVSTHPEVIFKIGTKKVLYTTREMDWGSDIELYPDYEDFEKRFMESLKKSNVRVLKQYRGSSGSGIFKICLENSDSICVTHVSGNEKRTLTKDEFSNDFKKFFENGGLLINQQWVDGIMNGMVRAFITGGKVSGFGYQEAVALTPRWENPNETRPTSRRFYFTEDCGLFQDLRKIMEEKWLPQLQKIHDISDEMMPLLWDIDLFINDSNTTKTERKYTLCEINVSGISPFPPSCAEHIAEELKKKLG